MVICNNLQEVDSVLSAQGLNETHVGGLIAVLSQDAQVSSPLVQGLGALRESTCNTVMNEGLFEDLLQGSEDIHNLGSLGLSRLNDLCISEHQSAKTFKSILKKHQNLPFRHVFVDVLTKEMWVSRE